MPAAEMDFTLHHDKINRRWWFGDTWIYVMRRSDGQWKLGSDVDIIWLTEHHLNCPFRTRRDAVRAATAAASITLPLRAEPSPVRLRKVSESCWMSPIGEWHVRLHNGAYQVRCNTDCSHLDHGAYVTLRRAAVRIAEHTRHFPH